MTEAPRGFVNKERLSKYEGVKKPEDIQLASQAETINRNDGVQEVAVVDGKRRVVLNDFLPEDIRFAGSPGAEFGHREIRNPRARSEGTMFIGQVEFPPEKLNTLTGRLALLHEMAHGIVESSSPGRRGRTTRHTIDTAYKVYDSIKKSGVLEEITSPEERERHYIEEFKKGWELENEKHQKDGFAPLRYRDLVEAVGVLAKHERKTWAETLVLYRRIKEKSGVDVLDGASKKDEIFRVIESESLGDYERIYGPLLRLAGEKDVEGAKRDWITRLFDHLERFASP